jgi:predicted CXXCH cytochrome family protein
MKTKSSLLCLAGFMAIALFAQNAWAGYAWDGAVQNGANGEWIVPNDMVCIVGLHTDGSLDIAKHDDGSLITNSRECIYLNKGTMNGGTPFDLRPLDPTASGTPAQAACLNAGSAGNDGARHSVATSICVDANGVGIPLTDLDRTYSMCVAKGGTWKQTSATPPYPGAPGTFPTPNYFGSCVAYTRQFQGQDSSGAPLAFGTKGTAIADAGFCYTTMRMTTAYPTAATCPASDTNGHPSAGKTSSDAYNYSWTGSQCTYAQGVKGYLNASLVKPDGTTFKSAGTYWDLSQYTTMGDCLAVGGSWNNWVGRPDPPAPGLPPATVSVATTPPSNIPAWDFSKHAPETTNGCLHCHSTLTQYNGPAERQKDTFVKTGHKNVLRKVTPGKVWAGPNAGGDLEIYTEAASGPLDFAGAKAFVNGAWQDLLYIFGDWMSPAPEGLKTIVNIGGVANSADSGGVVSSELCASCHTTGWSNPSAGLCSLSSKTNSGDCASAGGTWYPLIGVQGIGTPGFASAQPSASFPAVDFTGGGQWDRDGIQCPRCHNVTAPRVVDTQIAASQFTSTHVTSGGMGALADGVGRTNLCFGCHQSIAKTLNGTGPDADLSHPENLQVKNTGTGNPADAPWTAYVPDFDGRGPGNMFLNSPHARFSGNIVPNALGKYDLADTTGNNNGNASKYKSAFQGYTCWQSATSTSPAKTMIVNGVIQEIKTKSDCESLYGAGAWRSDLQGTCVTCHDVHNSLFVETTREAALRKVCTDCHTDSIQRLWHPTGKGTPLDVSEPFEACVTCHMPRATPSGLRMHMFRINPSNGYSTFPTAAEFGVGTTPTKMITNSSPDGSYTNAVWVDVDYACGQCHGGSRGADATKNGAPYFTKQGLSDAAKLMHKPGAAVSLVNDISGYTVTLTDSSTDDSIVLPTNAVTIDWGDKTSSTGNAGGVFVHTYGKAKKYQIVYSVTDKYGYKSYKKLLVTIHKGGTTASIK